MPRLGPCNIAYSTGNSDETERAQIKTHRALRFVHYWNIVSTSFGSLSLHCCQYSRVISLTIRNSACVTSAVRIYYNVRLWKNQTDITHQLAYMSFWGTAQLPAGFLVTCLPGIPKVVNYARTKPWCLRLETSLRSVLKVSTEKVHTTRQIVTIGGGPKKNHKGTVVSDLEFRDLVASDQMSLSSTSHINTVARGNFRDEA